MSYYRIFKSNDQKQVGTFPQLSSGGISTSFDDPQFLGNFLIKKAPADALLPHGELAKKAKATDLLSTSSSAGFVLNLVVSEKMDQILQRSQYIGMQFFPTQVQSPQGTALPYTIVHPYDFAWTALDFGASEFFFQPLIGGQDEQLYLNNADELLSKLATFVPGDTLLIKKVVILQEGAPDFFALRTVDRGGLGYFVSETLKDQLEAAQCTGIVFEPLPVP